MKLISRALCALALIALPLPAAMGQEAAPQSQSPQSQSPQSQSPQPQSPQPQSPQPQSLQSQDEVPWLYRGSDVPVDREWLFGEMANGLRYAVRRNGVPPRQVSIRIRIDAGSLHEKDAERGFAHLLEHMSFRESRYLGPAQAIPTWQRLGATFGSDTNAETTPTHTVYKLDLPNIDDAKLEESIRLLSGMIREPVLNQANVDAEVPIVLAEKRERGGAAQRVNDLTRQTLFAGQLLATRMPIGTEETLLSATGKTVKAFHQRWYRPENAVIVVAGDADPRLMAVLIERYFGDWQGKGKPAPAPDFGDPRAPQGADPANPLGEMGVIVEPDMPRSLTYAVLRPWRPVQDTIAYNEGLLLDAVAQSIINRRLEARARAGGSYLYAQVQQDDVSRSTDATFVSFAPLSGDWQTALADVRAVIADALAEPPTQEEIDRELAEFEIAFASEVEQASVQAGSQLADTVIGAVDIRETVAAPNVVLDVFQGMRARFTPEEVQGHTRALFEGEVIRSVLVTPDAANASKDALRQAMAADAQPDSSSRLAAAAISFDELPAIGEPGTVVSQAPVGLLEIEQVELSNGTRAILWANDAEPGRVTVKVRFGTGYRAFQAQDAPYVVLGEMALVGSGLGELGQEELDRLSTGRKLGFDFAIDDAVFTFTGQTRADDVADQLYLFAAKLGMPRWDANPVLRAKAAAKLAYDTFETSPGGVLNRDLEFLLKDRDGRFATPDPAVMEAATPEGFRKVWEPLLQQGPIEVLIFGEFDRDATVEALRRTFGALPARTPLPAAVATRLPRFPAADGKVELLTHRGDANQAAAVVAWPSGGGIEGLRESRQLEILTQVFNNRLMDALRERAGASYAPQVVSEWPTDLPTGGTIMAFAQLQPRDVPAFFAAAGRIANDLATTPPSEDELARVTEPLRQLVSRASTGNGFWLYHLEGASSDRRRIDLVRSLLNDYSRTTPEIMLALARRYFGARPGWQLAVIPEGQTLAQASVQPPVQGRKSAGRRAGEAETPGR